MGVLAVQPSQDQKKRRCSLQVLKVLCCAIYRQLPDFSRAACPRTSCPRTEKPRRFRYWAKAMRASRRVAAGGSISSSIILCSARNGETCEAILGKRKDAEYEHSAQQWGQNVSTHRGAPYRQ